MKCANYLQLFHRARIVFLFGNDQCEPKRSDDAEDGSLVSGPEISELLMDVQNSPDSLQNDPGVGGGEGLGRGHPEGDHEELPDLFVIHVYGSKRILLNDNKSYYH